MSETEIIIFPISRPFLLLCSQMQAMAPFSRLTQPEPSALSSFSSSASRPADSRLRAPIPLRLTLSAHPQGPAPEQDHTSSSGSQTGFRPQACPAPFPSLQHTHSDFYFTGPHGPEEAARTLQQGSQVSTTARPASVISRLSPPCGSRSHDDLPSNSVPMTSSHLQLLPFPVQLLLTPQVSSQMSLSLAGSRSSSPPTTGPRSVLDAALVPLTLPLWH